MPTNLVMYHENDVTLVSNAAKVEFGSVDPGLSSDILRVHLWNDKGGVLGSDTAVTPRLSGLSVPDNVSVIWNGTVLNGLHSMLEGRSCRAFGVVPDFQTEWSPIGPNEYLVMGNIPSNAMREIELRLRVPVDSPPLTPLKGWQIRIHA